MPTRALIILVSALLGLLAAPAHAIYDAGVGRWLQRDPLNTLEFGNQYELFPHILDWSLNKHVAAATPEAVAKAIGDVYADQSHLYRYVRSNPTVYKDPFGLTASPPFFDPTDPANFGRRPGQTLSKRINWRQFMKNRAKGAGFITLLQIAGCAAAIVEMDMACRMFSDTDEIWAGCFCEQLTSPPGPARILCNLASKKSVTGFDPIESAREAAGCDMLKGTCFEATGDK